MAKLWGKEQISDNEFVNAMRYLIDNKIIDVRLDEKNESLKSSTEKSMPTSTKALVKLWANGQIADTNFEALIKYYRILGVW